MRRSSAGLAALLLAASCGLTACSSDPAEDAVTAFLNGWSSGKLDDVGFVTAAGGKIASTDVTSQINGLYGDLTGQPLAVTKAGATEENGDNASTPITVKWTLPGGTEWSYRSTVRATKAGKDGWSVVWEPSVVQPELAAGEKLRLRRVAATRAGILDASGKTLVGPQKVTIVGVSPERITDLDQLKKDLAAAFARINVDVGLDDLKDRVDKAEPGAFLDLISLRQADYQKIRAEVRPLPGTVFRDENRQLAPTRAFARALLGTVDPATEEDLAAKPGVLLAGDETGHSGLQQKYDDVLRGAAGLSVVIAREAADGATEDTKLFTSEPVAGKPIKVTLDTRVQNAADTALAAEKQPSSLVAIRVSDGAVLASANGPEPGGVNTAFTGQVPRGRRSR
ncbi:NTF2-like N-terminal transpeptidase domain-containing protein [Actinoplanes sp. CA-252034]|uniref:NTF2-like N-terminal transpeptidase domain-containing protein n=1 Tax=Actinoplanes sp. CA-252034 TaxID=3239906 RepID=UPI003D96B5FE